MLQRYLWKIGIVLSAWAVSYSVYSRWEIAHRGGPVMVAILMCSVFTLTIIFERALFFARIRIDAAKTFAALEQAVRNQRWDDAEVLCQQVRGPLARVMAVGLKSRGREADHIDRLMEEAAHDELPLLQRRHGWLATLAQVATLLGLLGTVTGMVAAFQTIQQQAVGFQPVSPADLAGGIWEALLTTVAGLVVAIPTILAYHYFAGKVEEVKNQIEKAAATIAYWRD